MINTPTRCFWNEDRRSSYLQFEPDNSPAPSGEYIIRGSICWPMQTETDTLARGLMLVAGQHVKTGVIWIFEQTSFFTVDDALRKDGGIASHGISSSLNRFWSCYFGSKIFWNGAAATHSRYLHQVYISKMISPAPVFIEVKWTETETALQTLWALLQEGKLRHDKDATLAMIIGLHAGNPTLKLGPEITALLALVNGYDSYRWNPPVFEETEILIRHR